MPDPSRTEPMSSQGERHLTLRDLEQFCCLELIRAAVRGHVATASGGVWIGPHKGQPCLGGIPQASFCPFCGSRIIVVRHEHSWSWRTQDKPTMHAMEHAEDA